MSATQYQLGFIGAGKLAGSVIRGLAQANFCKPGEIIASEPAPEIRSTLEREIGIATTTDNLELARSAEIIFLGLKPQMVLPVLREIAAATAGKLVVSFAAGVRLSSMEEIASARLMRVMTNTPAAIGRAATGIAAGTRATRADVDRVSEIFGSIGVVAEIHEKEIDAVTALAGSGPAFAYTCIEALAAGGVKAGLGEQAALQLAIQTVLGAAELALTSGKSPEELRRMVVTPGGTTAAGLEVMDKMRTSEGLVAAVEAATRRGQEMARENV